MFAYRYLDIDWSEAAHGRAPAVATAIKRVWPDRLVFTYQGDGDMACIGSAETLHALNRGEHITMIFINNAIYGMTGGQMAPHHADRPKDRHVPLRPRSEDPRLEPQHHGAGKPPQGYPLRHTPSVDTVASIRQAKKAIRKAFEANMAGKGSCLIEIVATCNTGWKLSPVKANEWMRENMFKEYIKGDMKDTLDQEIPEL